jgi:hypothetical protein
MDFTFEGATGFCLKASLDLSMFVNKSIVVATGKDVVSGFSETWPGKQSMRLFVLKLRPL